MSNGIIKEIKEIRVAQDAVNQRIEVLAQESPIWGAELTLARRSGQTVRHWLGEAMVLIWEHEHTGQPKGGDA